MQGPDRSIEFDFIRGLAIIAASACVRAGLLRRARHFSLSISHSD